MDVVGLPCIIEYLGKTNYAPVILRGLPVFNHYITPLGCFLSAFWLQSNSRKLHSIEKNAILLRSPENSRIDAPRSSTIKTILINTYTYLFQAPCFFQISHGIFKSFNLWRKFPSLCAIPPSNITQWLGLCSIFFGGMRFTGSQLHESSFSLSIASCKNREGWRRLELTKAGWKAPKKQRGIQLSHQENTEKKTFHYSDWFITFSSWAYGYAHGHYGYGMVLSFFQN